MDPNNPWPEESYSDWFQNSTEETSASESELEDEFWETLRRYNPTQNNSNTQQTHLQPQKSPSKNLRSDESQQSSSSFGTTLAPDTPPHSDPEVVLDTPKRPNYVEPNPESCSYSRSFRRSRRCQLSVEPPPSPVKVDDESQFPDSWDDFERHLLLLQKHPL